MSRDSIERYLDVLTDEYDSRKYELDQPVSTVYIGGGTPSILSGIQLNRLFRMLPSGDGVKEYTIEVNPEDVDFQFIDVLRQSPVNRVSMGVQSLNDKELAAIGRRHTAGAAIEAARKLIRNFPNTSLDLMFGIPGQTLQSWTESITRVLSLRPAHISAYTLMLEPGTRLYTRMKRGECQLPSQEENDGMYRVLCQMLSDAGYVHYEISNFALSGRESIHNSNYWNFTPYLGIGASAHSYDGLNKRSANTASLHRYLEGWQSARTVEQLTVEERREEYIMLSLRRAAGLDLADYESRFGIKEMSRLMKAASFQISKGNMFKSESRLMIAPARWLVSDAIIVSLL